MPFAESSKLSCHKSLCTSLIQLLYFLSPPPHLHDSGPILLLSLQFNTQNRNFPNTTLSNNLFQQIFFTNTQPHLFLLCWINLDSITTTITHSQSKITHFALKQKSQFHFLHSTRSFSLSRFPFQLSTYLYSLSSKIFFLTFVISSTLLFVSTNNNTAKKQNKTSKKQQKILQLQQTLPNNCVHQNEPTQYNDSVNSTRVIIICSALLQDSPFIPIITAQHQSTCQNNLFFLFVSFFVDFIDTLLHINQIR